MQLWHEQSLNMFRSINSSLCFSSVPRRGEHFNWLEWHVRHRFVGIKRSIKTNEKTGNNEWWIRRRFQIHCVVNWSAAAARGQVQINVAAIAFATTSVYALAKLLSLSTNEWNLFMSNNGRPQMKYQLETHIYRRAHTHKFKHQNDGQIVWQQFKPWSRTRRQKYNPAQIHYMHSP